MLDGAQNPNHRVMLRFGVRAPLRGRARVGFRTVNRRPLAWRSHRSRNVTGDTAAPAAPPATGDIPLDFGLTYNHPSPNQGFSWVCVDATAASGALLNLTLSPPSGADVSGTLQLQRKATATARGTFSFKILSYGTHQVRIVASANGKRATKTKSIDVTGAPGSSACGP